MSEKVCVVTYVFGEKYQGFIPLYIYSLKKLYPSYDVKIYIDGHLAQDIKEIIKKSDWDSSVQIYENYVLDKMGLNTRELPLGINKALRWLIFEEEFLIYDYLYFGDIDIIFCYEQLPLHKQHINHMNYLKLPYSNVLRTYMGSDKPNYKSLIKYILPYKLSLFLKEVSKKKKEVVIKRLTGLHFINAKNYYNEEMILQIKLFISLIKEKNKNFFLKYLLDDELLLHDLVLKSDHSIPNISPPGLMMDSTGFLYLNFRPHHGLHLGVFFSEKSKKQNFQLINSEMYKEYFVYFKELCNDPYFKDIIKNSPIFIKENLGNVNQYYGSLENDKF